MIKTGEFYKGLQKYLQANQLVIRFRLWPYLMIPGILSLLYMILLIAAGSVYSPAVSAYISDHWIPAFLQGRAMMMLTAVLVWMMLLILGYMTYKYVILILFSPILSHLSETVEKRIYNQPPPPFSFKALIRDFLRSLILNLRNMLLTIIFTFFFWLLVFIPIVGAVISPILIILLQAFYDGFGLVDFTLERKRYSIRESIRFSRLNRARIIGIGLGFMLMLLIPIIGWFAAPTYGTIAATLAALEQIHSDRSTGLIKG